METKSDKSEPISESTPRKGIVGAVILTVWHAAIWLSLMGVVNFIVPIWREKCENSGLKLPPLSELVIAASYTFQMYWYIITPTVLLVVAIADSVLRKAGREKQRLAAALFTWVPLLLVGLVSLGMLLPWIDYISGLFK